MAEQEDQLSQEAEALAQQLERLAGSGTRVGHDVAINARNAARLMEGAAAELKKGNGAGAGRRGTLSSSELEKVVTALEKTLGPRPELRDVSQEEAPKEYERYISEYFRKLSYEK